MSSSDKLNHSELSIYFNLSLNNAFRVSCFFRNCCGEDTELIISKSIKTDTFADSKIHLSFNFLRNKSITNAPCNCTDLSSIDSKFEIISSFQFSVSCNIYIYIYKLHEEPKFCQFPCLPILLYQYV